MARPRFSFFRSVILHPGSWVLLALIALIAAMIITAAAPWLLAAIAPVCAVIIAVAMGLALLSSIPYVGLYLRKLDTVERKRMAEATKQVILAEKEYEFAPLLDHMTAPSHFEARKLYVKKEDDDTLAYSVFNRKGILVQGKISWVGFGFNGAEKRTQFKNALKDQDISVALKPLLTDILNITNAAGHTRKEKSLEVDEWTSMLLNTPVWGIGVINFLQWILGGKIISGKQSHPWQVFFVGLGVAAFIVALVLTIGFFTGGGAFAVVGGVMVATGGGAFAFMGSVFAPIAGLFAASTAAGVAAGTTAAFTPGALAFISGLLFTIAPLNLIANTPKRLLSFFGASEPEDDSIEKPDKDSRETKVSEKGVDYSEKQREKIAVGKYEPELLSTSESAGDKVVDKDNNLGGGSPLSPSSG